jgi:hypothetical protein
MNIPCFVGLDIFMAVKIHVTVPVFLSSLAQEDLTCIWEVISSNHVKIKVT